MKTENLLAIFLILSLIGCEKDESKTDKNPGLTALTFTGCFIGTKSTDSSPSVRLIGQTGDKLLVQWNNTEFCCGTDSITLNESILDTKIDIEVIDEGPYTYCYCPHNVEFTLNNLSNNDYVLTLIESEHAYYRDTILIHFHYSSQMDTLITESNPSGGDHQIAYVKTKPGGCNNAAIRDLKSTIEENDTVIASILNDTLDLCVGINYVCCAPFTSETNIQNDSILITVHDTCSLPYQNCYCKCMCYYTWNFLFSNIQQKTYTYKVILINPGEENPIVFGEGKIEVIE